MQMTEPTFPRLRSCRHVPYRLRDELVGAGAEDCQRGADKLLRRLGLFPQTVRS